MRGLNFRDMGLRPKLAILMTVLGGPMLVLLVLLYDSTTNEISVTNSERDGLAYVTEGAMPIVYEVQRHRLLTAAVLRGESAYQAALDESRKTIDSLVTRLSTFESRYGSDATRGTSSSISERWEAVKATSPSSPDDILRAHTTLIEQHLIPLIFAIGNDSNLYRDPEINTLNTAIGVSLDLVRASEASTRAAAHLVASNPFEGAPEGESNRELAAAQAQAAVAARDSMNRWLEQAMRSDPEFRSSLASDLSQSNAEADRLAGRVEANLATTVIDIPDLMVRGESTIETNEVLFAAGSSLVSSELGDRASSARTSQLFAVGFSVSAFLVGVAVAFAIAASILRPMRHLAQVADQMSLGELDVQIDIESKNEIGQLAESLRRMQASLAGAIERLRARRAA